MHNDCFINDSQGVEGQTHDVILFYALQRNHSQLKPGGEALEHAHLVLDLARSFLNQTNLQMRK